MPIGILMSLFICTILYMVFAHVMTGVAHYTDFAGQQGIAPVAVAIDHMGHADAAGIIHPRLSVAESRHRTCHPFWLLFRHYGNLVGTKPCFPQHEP